MPRDRADPNAARDERSRSQRAQRAFMRLLMTMAAGYAFESLLLFGFWFGDYIPLATAAGFSSVFLGAWLLLGATFRWGWNLRLRDPTLFLPQYTFSVVLSTAMMLAAPQISIQPLAVMSVIFVHSFTAPDRRSLVIAWTMAGAAVVTMIAVTGAHLGMPSATPLGRALILLVMVGCMTRCMGFATYVRQLQVGIRDKNAALKSALKRNEELLFGDELTGVANRRSVMRFIGEQTALFERTGTPFCVALIDVDLFKRVNDEHGHLIGDKALTTLAQIADAMTRASDCFGRYGGEEFIALFAATRMAQARVSLERIRAGIEAHDWTGVAPGLAITVTCGVAQFARGDSIESIIRRADEALYAGKNAGRNRVVGERADGGAAAENRADPERLMRV